jgi:thiol-disulfide isomerase/thioredoxin
MRPAQFIPALGLIALSAGIAGFLGYRGWQDHRSPLTHTPGKQGDAPLAVAYADPVGAPGSAPEAPANHPVPESVPDLQLPDRSGQLKSLRDYLGAPLIINFWATWCAPCRREIPLLQQLRQTYKGERLEIVGIALDFRGAVNDFLAHTPISYPLLIGEDRGLSAAEEFGMQPVLPFSIFADARGQIIAIKVGELHRDEADYILTAMHSVASGQMSLATAREGIAEKLRTLAIERAKARNNDS